MGSDPAPHGGRVVPGRDVELPHPPEHTPCSILCPYASRRDASERTVRNAPGGVCRATRETPLGLRTVGFGKHIVPTFAQLQRVGKNGYRAAPSTHLDRH